jgi:hypothetical protein
LPRPRVAVVGLPGPVLRAAESSAVG